MYANAPHASAATTPLSPLQHQTQVQHQHGHTQGMPPAAAHGGQYGIAAQGAPAAPAQQFAPSRAGIGAGTSYVTGAYQSSGDPAIDRMLRLEAACKRFGSPI